MIDPSLSVIMLRFVRPILVVIFIFCLLIGVGYIGTLKGIRPVSNHNLCVNACGDGTCQNFVCLGQGCFCSENPVTCAQDCKR